MREKKPNKRKVQGAETKKKIYAIAERLFMEGDFASVSVEDITDAAGITKGTFYVHFESKDALIALLIAEAAARTDAGYKAFWGTLPEDMSTPQVLTAFIEKIAEELTGTIGKENMNKVYQILLAGTVDTEAVKGYNRELYTLFYEILDRGVQRGELKPILPLEILSRHLVMAIRGISYEWCVCDSGFDLKEEAVAHFNLLLKGLLK